jgi:sugar phosphate isomerase/epimerase
MRTHTGNFPIGFRRGWTDWQKDVAALAAWGAAQGFEAIDLNMLAPGDAAAVAGAGLKVGSVDLIDFGKIAQPDPGRRRELIDANIAYIKKSAADGATWFFTIVPGEPERTRAQNYKAAVEAFAPLAEAAAAVGGSLAIEGYPGSAPHYALLCTTPETCRAMLKDLPRGVGLNYDPSHLIRLGVDHIRFLREFIGSVVHVHAKDTQLFPEVAYELGLYQPSAFAEPHGFGDYAWRYSLPGRGAARWPEIFAILRDAGYPGVVSVELEDEHFNGTPAGEKAGLVESLRFLRTA